MKSKAELFRQIGWSDELIKHFTICDDTLSSESDEINEPNFFDSETAVIKFDVASTLPSATVLIKQ